MPSAASPGPAGRSFRESVLGEAGRLAQDLVLRLEPAAGPAQPRDLGLLALGQAVFDTVIDVGLAHPATHRLGRDVEVGRDLVDRQVTTTGDGDDVALELRR